jgi:hypothetical protein
VESWAEEKPDYDGGLMNNKNFAAGHYTQMIWGKTTHVGCATVKCKDGSHIVVCNYNPPGNYIRLSSSLYQTQIDFTRSAHEAKGSSFTPTLQGSEERLPSRACE